MTAAPSPIRGQSARCHHTIPPAAIPVGATIVDHRCAMQLSHASTRDGNQLRNQPSEPFPHIIGGWRYGAPISITWPVHGS